MNQELRLSCKCIRKSGVRLGGGGYPFNPSFTHSVYYTNPNSRSEDAIMPKESIIVIFSYVKH